MAEPEGAGARTPILGEIPFEIAIWEILTRLPAKPLLRCQAVCRAWRHATSTLEFLQAHHGRQLCLHLVESYGFRSGDSPSHDCVDMVTLDPRAAAGAKQQPVCRLEGTKLDLEASCDGLFILSDRPNHCHLTVCNPATRQYAPLQLGRPFMPLGMYLHPTTGEYRLLLYLGWTRYGNPPRGYKFACFVFALGSGEQPRQIGSVYSWVEREEMHESVLVCGSLHWYREELGSQSNMILVFDTTAEVFWQMRAPVVSSSTRLFEMDGTLGMSTVNDEATIVDIWVMKDYESEVWAFKCRVELPVAEIRLQFGTYGNFWTAMVDFWNLIVVSVDGELLVLLAYDDWLLLVDMDGKLVDSSRKESFSVRQMWFKQTLIPHTFFPTLEVQVANASPFI